MPTSRNSTPSNSAPLIAGLLFDASKAREAAPPDAARANRLLDRAIEAGELFLASASEREEILLPEVLYNLAAALYQRGKIFESAARFKEVGRDHREFSKALKAITYAVQMYGQTYADPSLHQHPELREQYLEALAVLVSQYANSDAARYWRFFYAQLLEEVERF